MQQCFCVADRVAGCNNGPFVGGTGVDGCAGVELGDVVEEVGLDDVGVVVLGPVVGGAEVVDPVRF